MGHVGRPALSVLAVALLMVAGCGSSSKSSSTTTVTTATTSPGTTSGGSTTTIVGTAELCADRTALRQSIQDLEHVQVITNGTSALEDALNKVKDNVDALKQSAHGVLQQPTQEFEDSLSTLESSIKNVGSDGISPVVSAAQDAAEKGDALLSALDAVKCTNS